MGWDYKLITRPIQFNGPLLTAETGFLRNVIQTTRVGRILETT
jgi:hypothetical protein